MKGALLCPPEPGPSQETQRTDPLKLWKRYARSGPGSPIEDELVNRYLPLVRTVVGRLAMTLPAHAATEDLYSAGLVGLLNAVRRYNHKAGVLFETYARVRIRGAVFDELRRLDWVPRSGDRSSPPWSRVCSRSGGAVSGFAACASPIANARPP